MQRKLALDTVRRCQEVLSSAGANAVVMANIGETREAIVYRIGMKMFSSL